MNTVLESTRQMVLMEHGEGADDLYLHTLQAAQIQEEEYFGHLIYNDLNAILSDIREGHKTDALTADDELSVSSVQEQLAKAIHFEGSSEEKQIRSFLATFGIDYDKLTKEQFVSLIEVLKLSKYLKSPISQRGKARPQLQHGKGKTAVAARKRQKETQIAKRGHTQPMRTGMVSCHSDMVFCKVFCKRGLGCCKSILN